MSWKGRILGAIIGLLFSPIGSVIGFILGYFFYPHVTTNSCCRVPFA